MATLNKGDNDEIIIMIIIIIINIVSVSASPVSSFHLLSSWF